MTNPEDPSLPQTPPTPGSATGPTQADFDAVPLPEKAPRAVVRPRSTTDELAAEFQPSLRLSTRRIEQIRTAANVARQQVLALGKRALMALQTLPPRAKLGVAGGAGLALLILILVRSCGGPSPLFVTALTRMHAGPAETGFPEIARLEPGEPVLVLEQADQEHWLLVRDSTGQVGYVQDYSLDENPPPRTPSEPFTRCSLRTTEPDPQACHARAKEQAAQCERYCAATPEIAGCAAGCATREADCVASCRTPAEAPPTLLEPAGAASAGAPVGTQPEEPDRATAKPEPKPKKKAPPPSRKKRHKPRK